MQKNVFCFHYNQHQQLYMGTFSPLIHDNQYKLFLPYRRALKSWCAHSAWVSTNALNPRHTRAS